MYARKLGSGTAILGIGALLSVFALTDGQAPEAGTLDPVYARPSEVSEVRLLRRGQTLGEVLAEASLDGSEQHALLLAFQEQASPRRMRAGTEIILRRRQEDGWLRGVDIALSRDETVRLSRDEYGWESLLVRTPVRTDTLYVSGVIEDVLWNAVVQNARLSTLPLGDRGRLIHLLDQVFQWQVDFSRQIQVGDYFRVAFERQVRPDGTMRSARLLAAELLNQGRLFSAIWFDPGDGKASYFDLEGNSVRRAFLQRPLEFRRISSRFSRSRFHPILRTWRAHRGIDYSAASGTPVQSTSDGVVTRRGWNSGGYGNLLEIRHANGFTTRYAHLKGFRAGLSVGSRVRQGEIVGYVGSTGLATAPHLHYELRRHGDAVDPLALDLPPGDPVPQEAWFRWEEERRERLNLLMRLPDPPGTQPALHETRIAQEQIDRE